MGVERQQGVPYQRLLFPEPEEGTRHDTSGDGGTGAGVPEEPQAFAASDPARALTERLMEEVCHPVGTGEPRPAVRDATTVRGTAGYR